MILDRRLSRTEEVISVSISYQWGESSPGSNFGLGNGMEKIFVVGISRFSFQPVSVTLLLKMQTTTNGLKPTDH
jgi:hypothetical protein